MWKKFTEAPVLKLGPMAMKKGCMLGKLLLYPCSPAVRKMSCDMANDKMNWASSKDSDQP